MIESDAHPMRVRGRSVYADLHYTTCMRMYENSPVDPIIEEHVCDSCHTTEVKHNIDLRDPMLEHILEDKTDEYDI